MLIGPREVVLVTCQSEFSVAGKLEEKHDIVPVDWHSQVSAHPPMYAISLNKSLMAVNLIRKSGCFVVNFMPFGHEDVVKKAMTVSGEFLEKCSALDVHEDRGEKVDCFHIREALGWLECELVSEHDVGDRVLFIARILFSQQERDGKRVLLEGDKFTTTR